MLDFNGNLIFTEQTFRDGLTHLMEVNDVENDIADLTTRLDNLSDEVDDDIGRMSYVRQLTAEFLELFSVLIDELDEDNDVDVPKSKELMNKMLGRQHRKRYYMSKFRL